MFVAITGYIAQFDRSRPPFFLAPAKVPLRRWVVNIVLFFSINVLNNHAFSYNISVPVHIILRSGGSITTMAAGYLYGKRYSKNQVTAVAILSFGVILAAWSDAQTKVRYACKRIPAGGGRSLLLFFRIKPNLRTVLRSALGSSFYSLLKFFRPSWDSTQRQLTRFMVRSGRRTCSILTFFPSHYFCRLRRLWRKTLASWPTAHLCRLQHNFISRYQVSWSMLLPTFSHNMPVLEG